MKNSRSEGSWECVAKRHRDRDTAIAIGKMDSTPEPLPRSALSPVTTVPEQSTEVPKYSRTPASPRLSLVPKRPKKWCQNDRFGTKHLFDSVALSAMCGQCTHGEIFFKSTIPALAGGALLPHNHHPKGFGKDQGHHGEEHVKQQDTSHTRELRRSRVEEQDRVHGIRWMYGRAKNLPSVRWIGIAMPGRPYHCPLIESLPNCPHCGPLVCSSANPRSAAPPPVSQSGTAARLALSLICLACCLAWLPCLLPCSVGFARRLVHHQLLPLVLHSLSASLTPPRCCPLVCGWKLLFRCCLHVRSCELRSSCCLLVCRRKLHLRPSGGKDQRMGVRGIAASPDRAVELPEQAEFHGKAVVAVE